MTWLELYELLNREYEQAFVALKGKIKNVPAFEDSNVEEVNFACECFSKTGKWPRISRASAWQVHRRLRAARDFAKFVACPKNPRKHPAQNEPMRASDSEMLHWILIEYWWKAGAWREIYLSYLFKD